MTTARDFGDIKALAITALAADPPITGVKAIEAFAGQLEDAIEGRCTRFPLLAVLYVATDFEDADGASYLEPHQFVVGIFAHSLRGPAALTAQAEELVRAVKQRLINARLAENLQPVKPVSVRLSYADAKTQVYEFAFSVSMDQEYQWPT